MKKTTWVACAMVTALLAGCAGGTGVTFGNLHSSEESRAEAACRSESGSGSGSASAGASAAYQACMAEFRRPERED